MTDVGELLIEELLHDPQRFDDAGRAYDLLQEYFSGFSIETLRPLLRSKDIWIQRSSSFIAAELGHRSQPLLYDVIPMLDSTEAHVQAYAMDVLTVCSTGQRAALFAHVARKLESNHEGLRSIAMDLVANADVQKLEAAARFFARGQHRTGHERGLHALAASDQMPPADITAMLKDSDPLVRRYGEVAKRRHEIARSRVR